MSAIEIQIAKKSVFVQKTDCSVVWCSGHLDYIFSVPEISKNAFQNIREYNSLSTILQNTVYTYLIVSIKFDVGVYVYPISFHSENTHFSHKIHLES